MLSRTRLAATAFNDGSINYRVYYQDSAFLLKESCYEQSKGWHVRENCIVASDAKKYSPLAATSWANGNEIRLYYMNKNKILERRWSVDNSEEFGIWQAGSDVKCTAPDPQTQLAVTCAEESDGSIRLRLFYQSTSRELRQTSYNSEKSQWEDIALESDNGKVRPIRGSSLAVSAGWATRLFYLATSRDVVTIKEDGGRWKSKRISKIPVAEKTPIAVAPPLELDESETETKLPAFFTDRHGMLLQKIFDTGKEDLTDDKPDEDKEESESEEEDVEGGGAITVAAPCEGEASVFYQSSATTISQYDVKERYPVKLGIPTSLGGDPRAYVRMTQAVRLLEEPPMLGLVERQKIDMMDATTRHRFIQRLTETVVKAFQGARIYESGLQESVGSLSNEFGLGIVWRVEGDKWKGRTAPEWADIWQSGATPLQNRLEAAQEALVAHNFGRELFNKYLYVNTLDQLCRYLNVGR